MTFSRSINQLENVTLDTEIEKVNEIFKTLLTEIQSYLGLSPVQKAVRIEVSSSSEPNIENLTEERIFSAGVKRDFTNNSLILLKDYSKYFSPIILREAYNCFLPNSLLTIKYVQIMIIQLVVNNLPKFAYINEWKSFLRNSISLKKVF